MEEERVKELEERVAQREAEVAELRDRLKLAAQKYRSLLLQGAPEVPEELVVGETVEEVAVYYGRLHTLDSTTSTIPPHLEEVVAMGAEGFACLEWANFAINRVNTGGAGTWREYLTFGQKKLGTFMEALARYGRRGSLRARRLYRPAEPKPSQATDWGP